MSKNFNSPNIPLVGGQKKEPLPPKADRALMQVSNLAKQTHEALTNHHHRLHHVENLLAFMMAERAGTFDRISEYELVRNVDDMSYASGMVWFNGKQRKFYEVESLLSTFKVEQYTEGESTNFIAKSEEFQLEIPLKETDEDKAWQELDAWCQSHMKDYHDQIKEEKKLEKEKADKEKNLADKE